MKAIIALVAFLFFLQFVRPSFAAITFTLSNPQKSDNEVTFNVEITGLISSSCPNTTCYLQAALTPQDVTHYFGYTKNHNGEWFQYVSSPETSYIQSTFYAFTPQSGSLSTTLTIRPDESDSNYAGTKNYNIKAWRYTGNSKSYSGSSDNTLSIELNAPTPTPTPTSTPTSAPTSTPTSTPAPTSTPTKTPTPSPIPNTPTHKPSATPTSKLLPTDVLGESTESGLLVSPTEAKLEKNVLISNRAKNSNTNFQKILMLVGIVFILSCAILTFHRFKQGRLNQDEKE